MKLVFYIIFTHKEKQNKQNNYTLYLHLGHPDISQSQQLKNERIV